MDVRDSVGAHVFARPARKPRVERAVAFGVGAEVDHGRHSVGAHRLASRRGQVADVIRTHEHARTRDTALPGKTTEVAGVLAVRPVEPAAYRFVYWGAFRARFSPYFFRSFIRASRVSRPAF